MCAWFSRVRAPKARPEETDNKIEIPGDLWVKCTACSEVIYKNELDRALKVCPKCNYHFRISARERVELLCDDHSFEEGYGNLRTNDPLSFKDSVKYKERLKKAEKKSDTSEALICGSAKINGQPVMLGVFNFFFLGGSMGIVVGEKLARAVEQATDRGVPMIIVSASGGARMQEGIFSLMQMAKVTAALVRHGEKGLPYISVLSDPTTGGVAASFAMLGDLIIAEPGALIGFAGPRVIEQTIHRKLPEGFQRAEFLLEHGMLDAVVSREEMKETLGKMLELLRADA